ncbi:MAG: hypothetical protein WKF84_26395 [Pyrinomonadaceae bacterium]
MAASALFLVGVASSSTVLTQTTVVTAPAGRNASTAAQSKVQDEVTVDIGGSQVAIDPRTGKLRQPTPEEARALAQSMQKLLSRSSKALTVTRHPDGTESVNVKGRFLNFSMAKMNADGTTSTACVDSAEETAAFLGVQTEPSVGQTPNAKTAKKSSQKSTKRRAHTAQ